MERWRSEGRGHLNFGPFGPAVTRCTAGLGGDPDSGTAAGLGEDRWTRGARRRAGVSVSWGCWDESPQTLWRSRPHTARAPSSEVRATEPAPPTGPWRGPDPFPFRRRCIPGSWPQRSNGHPPHATSAAGKCPLSPPISVLWLHLGHTRVSQALFRCRVPRVPQVVFMSQRAEEWDKHPHVAPGDLGPEAVALKVTSSQWPQAGHAFVHRILTPGARGLLTEPLVGTPRGTLCPGGR